jgi:hypothetical protein
VPPPGEVLRGTVTAAQCLEAGPASGIRGQATRLLYISQRGPPDGQGDLGCLLQRALRAIVDMRLDNSSVCWPYPQKRVTFQQALTVP